MTETKILSELTDLITKFKRYKSPNLNSPDDSINLQILELWGNSLENKFSGIN